MMYADRDQIRHGEGFVVYPVVICTTIITLLSALWWVQLVQGFLARGKPKAAADKGS